MAIQWQVTLDANDPARLAEFWALALGYMPQPPPEGFDSWEDLGRTIGLPEERWGDQTALIDPDGKGPRLFIQRVPEGKTAKNRVHLDVQVGGGRPDGWADVEAHAERLVEAGATRGREVDEPIGRHLLMQDPEGNEFCVE